MDGQNPPPKKPWIQSKQMVSHGFKVLRTDFVHPQYVSGDLLRRLIPRTGGRTTMCCLNQDSRKLELWIACEDRGVASASDSVLQFWQATKGATCQNTKAQCSHSILYVHLVFGVVKGTGHLISSVGPVHISSIRESEGRPKCNDR